MDELPDLEGVVTLRREALASGLTDKELRRLIKDGSLHRVRRGAYVSKALWDSLDEAGKHRVHARAVLKTAHPSTVLTHTSAALEHGAPVWGVNLREVHVTRTDGRAGRNEAGIVHHRGALTDAEVIVVNSVPVTKPARVAVEICTIANTESALITANGLLHAEAMTPAELRAAADEAQFWPRSLNADLVVRLADPRIETAIESRMSFLCWAQHLPKPIPQVEVHDERGHLVGRIDFAWPDYNTFAELDGKLKYAKFRREGETLDQYLMREKQRQELISLLTGWTCIRIMWRDFAYPELLAGRIRRVLALGAAAAS